MPQHFHNFDLTNFWNPEDWATRDCTDVYPTDEMIELVERTLGYKLPASYIELMQTQNGGAPNLTTIFVEGQEFRIDQLLSIGESKHESLLGTFGSQFWIDDWDFPSIGIYFANTGNGGHSMFCLDYRQCGPSGEPQVSHIYQIEEFVITIVAPNFETFIRGLQATGEDSEFELTSDLEE